MNVKEKIRALQKENSDLVLDKTENALILNKQFKSVFSKESHDSLPEFMMRKKLSFDVEHVLKRINQVEIEQRLQKLNVGKSMGPAGIHPKILKECVTAFSKPLFILFRKSIEQKRIQKALKNAFICPIFKKGASIDHANCRPISLTSIVSKIIEVIVRNRLLSHLIEQKLLTKAQNGIFPRKSCLSNLLETLDFISRRLTEWMMMRFFWT